LGDGLDIANAGGGQISGGVDHQYAGRGTGLANIQRRDAGVAVGRAQDVAVDQAIGRQVIDKTAPAAQQFIILAPQHRLADPELAHEPYSPFRYFPISSWR